jgi:hypothetical protein
VISTRATATGRQAGTPSWSNSHGSRWTARAAEKKVEFVRRRDGTKRELPLDRAAETVAEAVFEERR